MDSVPHLMRLRSGKRLVIVRGPRLDINVKAVSASLDRDPFFAKGHDGSRLAWRAVRLHHRCRPLSPAEAVNGRLGSIMHNQWDAAQGLAPGPLIERVVPA